MRYVRPVVARRLRRRRRARRRRRDDDCAGDDRSADPGRVAIEAFAAAARAGDARAMWALLSTSSRQRARADARGAFGRGPCRGAATGSSAPSRGLHGGRLRAGHAGVRRRRDRRARAHGKRDGLRRCAAARGRRSWKVELGGPVGVRPLGPRPGAREDVSSPRSAPRSRARAARGTAVMYLDGQTVGQPKVLRHRHELDALRELRPGARPRPAHGGRLRERRPRGDRLRLGLHREAEVDAGGRGGSGALEALDGQHEHEDREPPGGYGEETHVPHPRRPTVRAP